MTNVSRDLHVSATIERSFMKALCASHSVTINLKLHMLNKMTKLCCYVKS